MIQQNSVENFSVIDQDGCNNMAAMPYLIFPSACRLHPILTLSCKFCRRHKTVALQAAAARQEGVLPLLGEEPAAAEQWGAPLKLLNNTTFNFPPVVREHILRSDYYKTLFQFHSIPSIIAEMNRQVDHAYPFVSLVSPLPSTFLCCVYKLCKFSLREGHVALLLNDPSAYVRAAVLLLLRLVTEADKLLDWFEDHLLSEDTLTVTPDGTTTTLGEFAEALLSTGKYQNSMVLPRLPQRCKTQLAAEVVALTGHRQRHAANSEKLHLFKEGVPVAALVDGEWQEGALLTLEEAEGQAATACEVRTSKGEVVTVLLGLCIVLEKKMERDKRRAERDARRKAAGLPQLDYSRCKKFDSGPKKRSAEESAVLEVRKRQKAEAVAEGKEYARRPTSFKANLSTRLNAPQPAAAVDLRRPEIRVTTAAPAGSREVSVASMKRLELLKQKYNA